MSLPERRTSHLRWGRVSLPGATYFITACVQARQCVLEQPATATRTVESLAQIHDGQDADVLAAVVMPDHVHLLFTLGTRLGFGQVLGKFKTLARQQGRSTWCWQENEFEHRLRAHESLEDYGFYIFMNPYRAGLIPLTRRWPWWFCPNPRRFGFIGLLGDGPVPKPWIEQSLSVGTRMEIRV